MTPDTKYTIQRETGPEISEYLAVLKRSGLAERRPVSDPDRVESMVSNANLWLTARGADGSMIGLARCITDFAHSCYIADLAVDQAAQGFGLGAQLLKAVRAEIHPDCHCHLISAPGAIGFYERHGFQHNTRVFDID